MATEEIIMQVPFLEAIKDVNDEIINLFMILSSSSFSEDQIDSTNSRLKSIINQIKKVKQTNLSEEERKDAIIQLKLSELKRMYNELVIMRNNRLIKLKRKLTPRQTAEFGTLIQIGENREKYYPITLTYDVKCESCKNITRIIGLVDREIYAPFACKKFKCLKLSRCNNTRFTITPVQNKTTDESPQCCNIFFTKKK